MILSCSVVENVMFRWNHQVNLHFDNFYFESKYFFYLAVKWCCVAQCSIKKSNEETVSACMLFNTSVLKLVPLPQISYEDGLRELYIKKVASVVFGNKFVVSGKIKQVQDNLISFVVSNVCSVYPL